MMIESSDFIIHFSLLIPRQSDKAFYHIHFISYHIHCFFQFKNYPPFTATRPRGKVPVRSISSGETKQRFQIKRITDNSRTCPHRVIGITILFDMCRHHQDRFSKIHRFTDRFKPCRTCISPATSHSVEKLDIINYPKRISAVSPDDKCETSPHYRKNLNSPYIHEYNSPLPVGWTSLPDESEVVLQLSDVHHPVP